MNQTEKILYWYSGEDANHWAEKRLKTFYSRIQQGAADECWPWMGRVDAYGYGEIRHANAEMRLAAGAHQVAYVLAGGVIEENLVVRHTCHNRLCCNPAHLVIGTNQENSRDRVLAGRGNTRKDSVEVTRTIRTMCAQGYTGAEIARALEISEGVIYRTCTWNMHKTSDLDLMAGCLATLRRRQNGRGSKAIDELARKVGELKNVRD